MPPQKRAIGGRWAIRTPKPQSDAGFRDRFLTNSDNLPVRACGGKYITTSAAPCPCAMVFLSTIHGHDQPKTCYTIGQ